MVTGIRLSNVQGAAGLLYPAVACKGAEVIVRFADFRHPMPTPTVARSATGTAEARLPFQLDFSGD
jgi:hypothetical protein